MGLEPDPISEIELLSINYLSHNSNLDEYDDINTELLSPRQVPGGRRFECVVSDDNDEEDDQTHTSGFSSSIQKTVKDIDGVLNEIRLRSSPDPDDIIFCSGNRHDYNRNYSDDDAMTETSYLTNTNLFMELIKADDSFMASFSAVKDIAGNADIKNNDENMDPNQASDDILSASPLDMRWHRDKSSAISNDCERENNYMHSYENDHVYSPEKNHTTKNSYTIRDINIHQEWNLDSYRNYPSKVHQVPSEVWNEMSNSDEDLEGALMHLNRQKHRGEKKKASAFFLKSMLKALSSRKRRGPRYQRQPPNQQEGYERLNRNQMSPFSSSSRLRTRSVWCAILSIVLILAIVIYMGTTSSWPKFIQRKNTTSIVGNPPLIHIDSNSSQINSTIQNEISIDVAINQPTWAQIEDTGSLSPTIMPPSDKNYINEDDNAISSGRVSNSATTKPKHSHNVVAHPDNHYPAYIGYNPADYIMYVPANQKSATTIEIQVQASTDASAKSDKRSKNNRRQRGLGYIGNRTRR